MMPLCNNFNYYNLADNNIKLSIVLFNETKLGLIKILNIAFNLIVIKVNHIYIAVITVQPHNLLIATILIVYSRLLTSTRRLSHYFASCKLRDIVAR